MGLTLAGCAWAEGAQGEAGTGPVTSTEERELLSVAPRDLAPLPHDINTETVTTANTSPAWFRGSSQLLDLALELNLRPREVK